MRAVGPDDGEAVGRGVITDRQRGVAAGDVGRVGFQVHAVLDQPVAELAGGGVEPEQVVLAVAIHVAGADQCPTCGVAAQRGRGESVAAVIGPQHQVVVVAGQHYIGQAIAVEIADGADVVAGGRTEGVRTELGHGAVGVVGVHQPVLQLAGVGVEQKDVRDAVAIRVAGYVQAGGKK